MATAALDDGRAWTKFQHICEAQGDYQSALSHRSKAIEEMRQLGDRRSTAELLIEAAQSYRRRERDPKLARWAVAPADAMRMARELAGEIGWNDGLRRTENLLLRHGVRALLVSKFFPGLTTVMPPLAGIFGIPRLRFVLYDLAGIVLWAGLWSGVGYVFSETIGEVARRVIALGHTAGFAALGILAGYVLLKLLR